MPTLELTSNQLQFLLSVLIDYHDQFHRKTGAISFSNKMLLNTDLEILIDMIKTKERAIINEDVIMHDLIGLLQDLGMQKDKTNRKRPHELVCEMIDEHDKKNQKDIDIPIMIRKE